jgi:serine protease Do
MRRTWFQKSLFQKSFRSLLRSIAAGIVLGLSPAIFAADAADSTAAKSAAAAAKSMSQSLRHVLDGAAPSGVSDLRAMQGHVQKLVDQLKQCTVGVQVGPAWGSGVIISKDGYVLTAAHVAEAGRRRGQQDVEGGLNRAVEANFTLADGREVKGKPLGLFRTLDAGLMKITTPGDYPHADLGNSNQLKEGQWCIAMGHPGGYQSERGSVLRLGRVLFVDKDAITTDCTLVGGDSGGPLFDMEGRVIGINSRIAERLTTNMHVPVNAYNERGAWDRMVNGEVWGHLPGQKPWLGVAGDGDAKDAKIANVTSKSPAEHYGLEPGDVVVSFDGREIADFPALVQAVADCHPNEWVRLRVKRGNEVREVGIRLGKKAE